MVDEFAVQEVRSSGELWSEICSALPAVRDGAAGENTHFTDCFQPAEPVGGRWDGTHTSSTSVTWEPMEDSEIYIATLGVNYKSCFTINKPPPGERPRERPQENRLKKLKGQSSDVTSRDMLRSLSQAKKECWDRFLHDAQTSELFQGGDMDESAVEHFKRWLIPEKVAISAEELEYLLRPSHNKEAEQQSQTQKDEEQEGEKHNQEEADTHSPEK